MARIHFTVGIDRIPNEQLGDVENLVTAALDSRFPQAEVSVNEIDRVEDENED